MPSPEDVSEFMISMMIITCVHQEGFDKVSSWKRYELKATANDRVFNPYRFSSSPRMGLSFGRGVSTAVHTR